MGLFSHSLVNPDDLFTDKDEKNCHCFTAKISECFARYLKE